ncbi:hypothetical protein BDD43_0816 [Mucilaginibacter gracilis]|uniref:Uncharacterized protein n=1 Tax=Mucilaginibacter gracilis TaxID=423350 RepID=A0A495IXA9_9SPHI|nr:hypothetical protein [Mucilaginibacter gracilis]RKR80684.1 hypothetical protein BDD43_0816 [Mucilaginibacter gracilis]
MKKILSICFTVAACTNHAHSQTKAQVMLQQIADVQIYIKTLKTGYQQTTKGLNGLHDLKNGAYDLHSNYFDAQKQASPAVRNNKKIPEIISDQQQIVTLFQQEIAWQKEKAILVADEISYLQQVNNSLIAKCNTDLDELNLVINDGTQMTDAQRIKSIDALYISTLDKYQFAQSFVHQARAFALDRQNRKAQSQDIRKLYDIN